MISEREKRAKRQVQAMIASGYIRRGQQFAALDALMAGKPVAVISPTASTTPARASRPAAQQRRGNAASASAPARRRARVAAAGPSAPARPPVESHEEFIRRVFPTIADQRGYATSGMTGFLLGTTPGAPAAGSVNASAQASGQTSTAREDQEHARVMAAWFPEVSRPAHTSRRARIHHTS